MIIPKIQKFTNFFTKSINGTKYFPNGNLTIGAEIELQIIDNQTLNLSPRSGEILNKCSKEFSHKIKQELFLNMLEINSAKCNDVHEIEQDIINSYNYVKNITKDMDISFALTGTHPISNYNEAHITRNKRYDRAIEFNQWLARRNNIFGLHVHIGINDQEKLIKFNNFFLNFIPHLIALSASSPFWCGYNTGLSAMRPSIYESHPTNGNPFYFENWNEFEILHNALLKSNSIESTKDLLWDIRPSPSYGTLEIRICDCPAKISDTMAIIAFIHLLANWLEDNYKLLEKIPLPTRWIARQNKFRAMRYGLNCNIIVDQNGKIKSIKEDIYDWLAKLIQYEQKLSYSIYIKKLRDICLNDNSSSRQVKIFKNTNSLYSVIKANIADLNDEF